MTNNDDYIAFNQYNSQLGALNSQKTQMKMLIDNLTNTIEEIDKSKTDEIFKNLGSVLIKSDKDSLKSDLNSEIESLNIRIKTLEKQEDIVTKKLQEIKDKLESSKKDKKE